MTCKKDKLEFRSCAVAISLSPFVEQSAFLVRTAGASWLACLQSPNPNPSVDVSSLFKDSGHSLHIAPLINIYVESKMCIGQRVEKIMIILMNCSVKYFIFKCERKPQITK